eukprot:15354766-Ditylum_brightwellii.AAC.1
MEQIQGNNDPRQSFWCSFQRVPDGGIGVHCHIIEQLDGVLFSQFCCTVMLRAKAVESFVGREMAGVMLGVAEVVLLFQIFLGEEDRDNVADVLDLGG